MFGTANSALGIGPLSYASYRPQTLGRLPTEPAAKTHVTSPLLSPPLSPPLEDGEIPPFKPNPDDEVSLDQYHIGGKGPFLHRLHHSKHHAGAETAPTTPLKHIDANPWAEGESTATTREPNTLPKASSKMQQQHQLPTPPPHPPRSRPSPPRLFSVDFTFNSPSRAATSKGTDLETTTLQIPTNNPIGSDLASPAQPQPPPLPRNFSTRSSPISRRTSLNTLSLLPGDTRRSSLVSAECPPVLTIWSAYGIFTSSPSSTPSGSISTSSGKPQPSEVAVGKGKDASVEQQQQIQAAGQENQSLMYKRRSRAFHESDKRRKMSSMALQGGTGKRQASASGKGGSWKGLDTPALITLRKASKVYRCENCENGNGKGGGGKNGNENEVGRNNSREPGSGSGGGNTREGSVERQVHRESESEDEEDETDEEGDQRGGKGERAFGAVAGEGSGSITEHGRGQKKAIEV